MSFCTGLFQNNLNFFNEQGESLKVLRRHENIWVKLYFFLCLPLCYQFIDLLLFFGSQCYSLLIWLLTTAFQASNERSSLWVLQDLIVFYCLCEVLWLQTELEQHLVLNFSFLHEHHQVSCLRVLWSVFLKVFLQIMLHLDLSLEHLHYLLSRFAKNSVSLCNTFVDLNIRF